MKVIKKINNNVAVCVDSQHHELIAFGKGIGFQKTPYELTDLSKIHRTYYGIDSRYLGLLETIPEDIFDISTKIVDFATIHIDKELSSNVVITLADHINFAIERYEKNMNFKMPISYDLKYLYENEMYVGQKGVDYINKVKKIHLPKDEAVGIAMHFINAENVVKNEKQEIDDDKIIEEITKIIEGDFSLTIDKDGFNYSRFVSHMHYLLKRRNQNQEVHSENLKLFESMKEDFKETYLCVCHIRDYLMDTLDWNPSKEELLYLMLHVNRLCVREDCYQ